MLTADALVLSRTLVKFTYGGGAHRAFLERDHDEQQWHV
jgi:hypothetical protein